MDGRATQSVTTTTLTRQRAHLRAHGKLLHGATGDDGVRYLQVWAVGVVGGGSGVRCGVGCAFVLKFEVAAVGCTPTLLINSIAKRDREVINRKYRRERGRGVSFLLFD